MKTAHWIVLAGLGFLVGACILGLNRQRGAIPSKAEASTTTGGENNRSPTPGKLNPSNPATPLTREQEAVENNFRQGKEAMESKDYDLAISYFSEAIRVDPNHVPSYHQRCLSFLSSGSPKKALKDANTLLKIDPSHQEPWLLARGCVYQALSEFDSAIMDFSDAIRLGNDKWVTYYLRANAYHSKGQYEKAIVDACAAIRLDPNQAEPYIVRGKAFFMLGKNHQSVDSFTKSLSLNRDIESLVCRANAYLRLEDYSSAIRDGEAALQLAPDIKDAHAVLFLAHSAMGNQSRAAFHEQRALALHQKGLGK